jgi:F-type H+-transporting ATPase subunit gamma
MAGLKEVRIRIASVISTQQITKAMKMVSAAKLRRAQDAILRLRPYASKLTEIMQNVSQSSDVSGGNPFTAVRPANKILIVAIASNRGLCGAFNSNIIRIINKMLREQYAQQNSAGNVKVLCIGKKVSDYFSKNKKLYLDNRNDIYNHLDFEHAAEIASFLMDEFKKETFDKVVIVYNQFKNAAVQYVTEETLMPLQPPTEQSAGKSAKAKADYIFEPNIEEIVTELIPKTIRTQLYKAILDSNASEHGARMTAMNKATENAGDMLKELRLSYNKARQAVITREILEIVGGAEALKG